MVAPAIVMHHLARSFVPVGAKHLLPRCSKRVVVIGGGPTGLFCADRLRHHFEVTVIDSKEFFEFTPGMLRALMDPAHYSRLTFDYREVLERQLGVEFICADASSLDAPLGPTSPGSVHIKSCSSGAHNKVGFDYCIVATGVSNGRWKPRLQREAALHKSDETDRPVEKTLEVRRNSLRAWREEIASAHRVVIVGAGLVGVELAAELAHFQPRLKVRVVDGASSVLPQLAEGARSYASTWLQQHGVKLFLGKPFVPELITNDDHVIWCVGTKTRSDGILDASVFKGNGQIRVNRRMQVLRRLFGSSLAADAALPPFNVEPEKDPGSPVELEPLGHGRIFAVGDAAAVEGVSTAQIIYHGEEMAAVAVANIEAAEEISSPFAIGQGRREAESGLPLLACTSLGPQDGMFSTQSELVATGALAALQKQIIEDTKMGALQGDPISSMLWMPVH